MLQSRVHWAAAIACAVVFGPRAVAQEAARIDPVVEVRQVVPEAFDPDQPVPVEVRVKNAGKVAVEDVAITDVLQDGIELADADPRPAKAGRILSWSLGRMDPGEERVLKLNLRHARGITNPRVVHALDVEYVAKGRSVAETRVRGPQVELKVAADGDPVVGGSTVLRLSLTNHGNVPARDVTLATDLPDGVDHPSGPRLEKDLGHLEPGKTRTIALTVKPKRAGDATATFRVHAKAMEPVEESLRLKVKQPALKLRTPAMLPVTIDRSTLFEMVVENDGTQAHRNVEFRVAVPEGIEFVRATDRGTFDAATRTIAWNLGTIEAGESRSLVWNGVAKGRGPHEWKATLTVEGKPHAETTCPVRVVPAPRDR